MSIQARISEPIPMIEIGGRQQQLSLLGLQPPGERRRKVQRDVSSVEMEALAICRLMFKRFHDNPIDRLLAQRLVTLSTGY